MTVIQKSNERIERKDISNALTTIEGNVSSNVTNIATNVTNIATNVTNISALDTRITTLEGGVNGTPPTSLLGRVTTNALLVGNIATDSDDAGVLYTASEGTYNIWVEIVGQAATNPGVITFLSVWQQANASSRDAGWRLSVDGSVVLASDNDFWQVAADNNAGASIVGGGIEAGGSYSEIPFLSSWSLESRKNEDASGSVQYRAMARWRI